MSFQSGEAFTKCDALCFILPHPSFSREGGHIPFSCNNQCSHQGLPIAESCLLAWHPSSAWDQGEHELFSQSHWPDWKSLQQNLIRCRSQQACSHQCSAILCQSETWAVADTGFFRVSCEPRLVLSHGSRVYLRPEGTVLINGAFMSTPT